MTDCVKESYTGISIHALLAESDGKNGVYCDTDSVFLSTLSLRRATRKTIPCSGHVIFLSTLSLRRATRPGLFFQYTNFISIHALLAESDASHLSMCNTPQISIHALLAESDLAGPSGPAFLYNFYPRSPCGERPELVKTDMRKHPISIHALLAESDTKRAEAKRTTDIFLSTLSLRRATRNIS